MTFLDVPPSPVPTYQNLQEFGALWEFVAGATHVIEIGSLFGGTLWHWLHLPGVRRVASVDTVTDWAPLRDGVIEARKQWDDWHDGELRVYELDSHDPATVATVAEFIPVCDFLFIDGDHTYEGVRADWLAWSPLVRPGGVVAFHDTWPNGDRHEPGVVRWVDELRHHLPSIEWTTPDGAGICAFTIP